MIRTKLKSFLTIFSILFFAFSAVFATEINLQADKTNISQDDVVTIQLSLDGTVDNNQISLSGFNNFEVLGRSSSTSMTYINGKVSNIQHQTFQVRPTKSGSFSIQVFAQENGKKISSQKIDFKVSKSLIQSTKDKLLSGVSVQSQEKDNSQNNIQAEKKQSEENQPSNQQSQKNQDLKKLLLSPSQNQTVGSQTQNQDLENLSKQNQLDKKFPKIEHIQPFNFNFYLQFFSILLLLALLVFLVFRIPKLKNKK